MFLRDIFTSSISKRDEELGEKLSAKKGSQGLNEVSKCLLKNQHYKNTLKLGYNEELRTGHFCSL